MSRRLDIQTMATFLRQAAPAAQTRLKPDPVTITTAPSKGWIINPRSDVLFFIGTPLLCLAALLLAARHFTSADIAWFVLAFFAVGHHLPGFMRAYGERELFQRYKARFMLAPVIITGFVGWSVFNGHLGFFIFLALWDMWHFFMQHYGFMRIYDVKRRPPNRLVARLDWLLVVAWFAYIVVASPHYLINFLERCHRYGFGFYSHIDPSHIDTIRHLVLAAAVLISLAYLVNLIRERLAGGPVVWPKLAITATTFATVYCAYILLEDIILGYAVVALAHDIQYFAIVWIYNHGVLKRSRDLGGSWFRFLFSDGRLRLVLIYLVLILMYGGIEGLARATGSYLIYDVVKVIIAASAFMHYYYDGFMWKVRRKEIRRNLVVDDLVQDEPAPEGLVERFRQRLRESVGLLWSFETGKMVVYFGIPIMLLAWTDAIYSQTDVQARQYLSRLTPSVASAHDDLGVAHMRERRYDEAIGALLRAIDVDPGYARAYTHLGIAFSAKGDRQRAIEYHRRAIELDPGMATAYFNLAVDYHSTDQMSSAIDQLVRAVELDPEYVKAYKLLSQIYKKQGDMTQYLKLDERARTLEAAAQRRFLGRSAMPWATATPVSPGGE